MSLEPIIVPGAACPNTFKSINILTSSSSIPIPAENMKDLTKQCTEEINKQEAEKNKLSQQTNQQSVIPGQPAIYRQPITPGQPSTQPAASASPGSSSSPGSPGSPGSPRLPGLPGLPGASLGNSSEKPKKKEPTPAQVAFDVNLFIDYMRKKAKIHFKKKKDTFYEQNKNEYVPQFYKEFNESIKHHLKNAKNADTDLNKKLSKELSLGNKKIKQEELKKLKVIHNEFKNTIEKSKNYIKNEKNKKINEITGKYKTKNNLLSLSKFSMPKLPRFTNKTKEEKEKEKEVNKTIKENQQLVTRLRKEAQQKVKEAQQKTKETQQKVKNEIEKKYNLDLTKINTYNRKGNEIFNNKIDNPNMKITKLKEKIKFLEKKYPFNKSTNNSSKSTNNSSKSTDNSSKSTDKSSESGKNSKKFEHIKLLISDILLRSKLIGNDKTFENILLLILNYELSRDKDESDQESPQENSQVNHKQSAGTNNASTAPLPIKKPQNETTVKSNIKTTVNSNELTQAKPSTTSEKPRASSNTVHSRGKNNVSTKTAIKPHKNKFIKYLVNNIKICFKKNCTIFENKNENEKKEQNGGGLLSLFGLDKKEQFFSSDKEIYLQIYNEKTIAIKNNDVDKDQNLYKILYNLLKNKGEKQDHTGKKQDHIGGENSAKGKGKDDNIHKLLLGLKYGSAFIKNIKDIKNKIFHEKFIKILLQTIYYLLEDELKVENQQIEKIDSQSPNSNNQSSANSANLSSVPSPTQPTTQPTTQPKVGGRKSIYIYKK